MGGGAHTDYMTPSLNLVVTQLLQPPVPTGLCGSSTDHGNKFKEREQKCPAAKHTCKKCGISGHFEKVCRKKDKKDKVNECQDELDFFCVLNDNPNFDKNIDIIENANADVNEHFSHDDIFDDTIIQNEHTNDATNEHSIHDDIFDEHMNKVPMHVSESNINEHEVTLTTNTNSISLTPMGHHIYESHKWV